MNTRDNDLDIGPRLRQWRLRLGLSQRELARRAGVSNATISMIEANRVNPSVSALKQVLSALGAGVADFFSSSEDEKEKVVFRADELTEIAGGALSYRQVGANLQGHALQMIHERYRPGAQSGTKMLSHQGEEAGVVIKGGLGWRSTAGATSSRRATLIRSTAASLIPSGISAMPNWCWCRPARRPASERRAGRPEPVWTIPGRIARTAGNPAATLNPDKLNRSN